MDQKARETYRKAIIQAARNAPKGTTLSHIAIREGGHIEAGYTRPVPQQGLELIAERATLPEGFELRPKRVRRSIIQTELPL
jgi:hypothetical protein